MELIIFGNSPFIHKVDVLKLIRLHSTLGFNTFASSFPVDYSFTLNKYIRPLSDKTMTMVHWEDSTAPEWTIPLKMKPSKEPFLDPGLLPWCCFGVSVAIPWAINIGFKDIYLVGIDHVETDEVFEHFDLVKDDRGKVMKPEIHQELKEYINKCQQFANIYQCNPDVAKDWPLPYKDIKELYV